MTGNGVGGWSGSGGLGAKEQGIQDPIKGGDVRDKWDQYKGVGVALDDPYENYRRNKSYSFIARMKARDEFSTFGTRKEEKED